MERVISEIIIGRYNYPKSYVVGVYCVTRIEIVKNEFGDWVQIWKNSTLYCEVNLNHVTEILYEE